MSVMVRTDMDRRHSASDSESLIWISMLHVGHETQDLFTCKRVVAAVCEAAVSIQRNSDEARANYKIHHNMYKCETETPNRPCGMDQTLFQASVDIH